LWAKDTFSNSFIKGAIRGFNQVSTPSWTGGNGFPKILEGAKQILGVDVPKPK
jgi:hypothetical protein